MIVITQDIKTRIMTLMVLGYQQIVLLKVVMERKSNFMI